MVIFLVKKQTRFGIHAERGASKVGAAEHT